MASTKLKIAALSVGKAANMSISILTMVIMTRLLDKNDVAAYRQTFLAYAVVAPILQLGVSNALYYFLPVEKIRIRGRVVDSLTILGCMGLAFGVFILLGGNHYLASIYDNPQVATLLLWLIPYAIMTVPGSQFETVLVARDKAVLASVLGMCRQVVIGITTIMPLILWKSVEAPLIGNVVASVTMSAAAIVLMIRATPKQSARPSMSSIKEILILSVPLAVSSMAGVLGMQADKIIVSVYTSPAEFAVYVLGAMEIPIIGILTGSITAVLLVEMRKSIVQNNPRDAHKLFKNGGEKSGFLILPVMTFLMINADLFMETLYTSEYLKSADPFRVYLLLLPLRTVVFGSFFIALGKKWFMVWRDMAELVLNIALSIYFVKLYGAIAAAYVTVGLTLGYHAVINIGYLSYLLKIKFTELLPYRSYAYMTMASLAVVLAVRFAAELLLPPLPKSAQFAIQLVIWGVWMMYWLNGRIYDFKALVSTAKGYLRR